MQTSMLCRPGCAAGCLQLRRAHTQLRSYSAVPKQPTVTRRPSTRRSRTGCRAAAKGDAAREQLTAVDPQPPPQRALTDSWVLKGAVAAFLVAVALSMLRRLGRRNSMSDLEDRGYLDESRNNTDPYLEDIMKNVNKVQYEELTEEQISAARKRRARGIADYRKADVDVPKNHPFATKKELTLEEEELIKQRLSVKRGAPIQDLSGRRGYPGQPGFDPRSDVPAEGS